MNKRISDFFFKTIGNNFPSLYYHLAYFHNHGRWPNLKKPKDLAEVIGRQCINGEINQYSVYADKVEVRKYIDNWLGEGFLPILYGVWDSFDDVDFGILPNEFALKTNHGCGGNVICYDKEKLDLAEAKRIIDTAMHTEFGGVTQTHYHHIPKKVFAEQLLTDNGKLPTDYKFHCWNGEIKTILCCADRGTCGHVKLKNYDTNWKPMNLLKKHEGAKDIPCPTNFEEMKHVATAIAQHFMHVRVDLYSFKGKTYVGELTFTPEGGLMRYYTQDALLYLAGQKDII